jgi:hypothetical protein
MSYLRNHDFCQQRIKRYAMIFFKFSRGRSDRPLKINFQMEDAKVLVIYWHEQGHDAIRIYQKLSTHLAHRLPAYSTAKDWLRGLERGDDITRRASGTGRLPNDCVDALIISILEQCPFHSLRIVFRHQASTHKSLATSAFRRLCYT